jgi:hypothetical protein
LVSLSTFPHSHILEDSYTETGCKVLAGIALDQVHDNNVERMAEDFRGELTQLLALGQISEDFYGRWDRTMSGLHQPDDDEMEAMRLYEGMYGGVEEDYQCPVEIYEGEPEGHIVATCRVPYKL